MKVARLARLGAAIALATATTLATVAPASARSNHHTPGQASLAALLADDGTGFDRNPSDFDILDNAVTAVLTAKPSSPVAVLADGSVALTAFLPTDQAFRRLAQDLTGRSSKSESRVFATLADQLGIDTIENVLLYHVVPGATITYKQARAANGATLATALPGATVTVKVARCRLTLVDADRDDANPVVVQNNLNRGNLQIAHGINRVLRPVDL